MPIYEYRCSTCSHELEALQKFSDPLLTSCPSCGTDSLVKKVSAAGFQLKGSGWYATDFKNGGKPAKSGESADKRESKPDKSESKTESKAAESAPACGAGACAACS